MDLRKVKKLIELVEESAIAELEVSSGDESVRIVMRHAQVPAQTVVSAPVTAALASEASSTPSRRAGVQPITAPMAGTFYRSPGPEAAPFVSPGQRVEAGEVLCIIESMKMMNEIRATQGGVIASVLVENAQPVATGEPLFELE